MEKLDIHKVSGLVRFAIQDVGQRELYSVGQYGGNLIDAERVDNPGVDNFLELQPGVNIEIRSGREVIAEGPTPCVANAIPAEAWRRWTKSISPTSGSSPAWCPLFRSSLMAFLPTSP